jgi:hypothetical protein
VPRHALRRAERQGRLAGQGRVELDPVPARRWQETPRTSYALECGNKYLLPRAVELAGSNDGGTSWTVLDTQQAPGFGEATPRREFALASPAKWNAYRLR